MNQLERDFVESTKIPILFFISIGWGGAAPWNVQKQSQRVTLRGNTVLQTSKETTILRLTVASDFFLCGTAFESCLAGTLSVLGFTVDDVVVVLFGWQKEMYIVFLR